MAHLIREAGPQEPIYGIHHANIVKRLTRQNWRTKAVARFDSKGWIYLWVIRRRYRHPAGGISANLHRQGLYRPSGASWARV
jgi:hypothetical protein